MQRVTLITIDQVRANMKIETRFQTSTNEKTVGDFGNFKAATAVSALQHNLRQWLFLSKSTQLKPSDPLGIDGWVLNVYTEKNKLAPSQYSIPLVFDKNWGVIPLYSEYYFLRELTRTEKKYWKDEKKLVYPLCVSTSGNSKVLTVYDPETKAVLWKSPKFMERNIFIKYRDEPEFHYWFDLAVQYSVTQRINVALFKNNPAIVHSDASDVEVDSDPDLEIEVPIELVRAGIPGVTSTIPIVEPQLIPTTPIFQTQELPPTIIQQEPIFQTQELPPSEDYVPQPAVPDGTRVEL